MPGLSGGSTGTVRLQTCGPGHADVAGPGTHDKNVTDGPGAVLSASKGDVPHCSGQSLCQLKIPTDSAALSDKAEHEPAGKRPG